MDKPTQLQALTGVFNALNQLPITGAQSELVTGIKQSIGAVANAIQTEIEEAEKAAEKAAEVKVTKKPVTKK